MKKFDIIPMSQLKLGDIFTHEIKAINREAFKVISVELKTTHCESRNTGRIIRKNKKGLVYWLRNEYA